MTYNKPNDKTYTEMCMYFDKHIYDDPSVRNDGLLYQYLYHIVYMLSCKEKYFEGPNSYEDYDKFALYAATEIYTRYINPKHMDNKIKSVLNYVKNTLRYLRVDYLKESFNSILGREDLDETYHGLKQSMEDSVQSSYCDRSELIESILSVFKDITKVVKDIVNRTPYSVEPIVKHRLVMSILLTLTNEVTLPNKLLNRNTDTKYKYSLYKKDKSSKVILWRLPATYSNLVHVLTARAKKECGHKVGTARADFDLSNDDVTAILMTAYGNVARDNNEEF